MSSDEPMGSDEDGGTGRPAKLEVLGHIHEAIDGSNYQIHAVVECGQSEVLYYYLVVYSTPHPELDDAEMLNERYFQIPTDWQSEYAPTFKTNGINRRDTGGLASHLSDIYTTAARDQDVRGTEWLAGDDPLWLNADDD
jgi:hypothetical protein